MNDRKTVSILKSFYFKPDSMEAISRRTQTPRDEVREILRGARSCGLIKYSTKDYYETFHHVEKKELGKYLKAKGFIK